MNISKKYRNIVSFLVIALVLVSCNEKADQTNNYRDLNKNGRLDTYEDSAASVEERIDDLLGLMNLEEKAGMLFNAISGIDMGENMGRVDSLITKVMINHLDMPGAPSAKDLLEINNSMQKIAEGTRLGIPITFYSDPRHSIRFSESAGEKRYHTRWPSELGFGAIGDADIVREFGDISRQEYTAVGIRLALHPMADLATEPRWFRTYTTFGEDADLSAKLTKAYILGFQGENLGKESVLCMTKHFPGGGPQKDGWDAHFETGKEQVYPGGMFEYHLKPFIEGALPAKTAQIMLYYGVPVGITDEQVAFGYN